MQDVENGDIVNLRKSLASKTIGGKLVGMSRLECAVSDFEHTLGNARGDAVEDSPVTTWLFDLEAGDQRAAQSLYEHFVSQVLALARRRIPAVVRSVYDEEDVAVSAFQSLFRGVHEQRFEFQDRTDFWRLLLTIAERKIARRIRHETRDKRDVRRLTENTIFLPQTPAEGKPNHREENPPSLLAREPTPEFAVEFADTCDSLLAGLPDDHSRQIALLKLENLTADEIAETLNCSRRTVQRRLLVIRRIWLEAGGLNIDADDVSQSGDESS